MGRWLGVLAAAVGAVAVAAPAAATADSVVFVRGGNVQLTGEQGTLQLTAGGGYENPSMADDGTIVAVRRTLDADGSPVRHVHRMDRSGRLLNPPTEAVSTTNSNYTGPLSPQVSPDGSALAFQYFNRGLISRPEMPRVAIAPTDRDLGDPADIFSAGFYLNPSWIGESTIVLFGTPGFSPNVQTYTLGGEGISDWFDPPDGGHLGSGEVSPDGTRMVATAKGGDELRFYALPGPPPALPRATCRFAAPGAGFERPRWAPDGSAVVWEQPDGLHMAAVPSIDDCPAITDRLVAPGGSDPDWGPADLPATTTPAITASGRAVRITAGCLSDCRVTARLVKAGRTVSRTSRSVQAGRATTLRLPKRGRRGRATVIVKVGTKVTRAGVTL